jgi:N-acetylmuramoyl-L-alanine amidase
LFEDNSLNVTRKYAAVLLAAMAGVAAAAFYVKAQPQVQSVNSGQPQTPGSSAMNRNLVLLDPAHGGADGGILLGDHTFEKDVTLAFATKLRGALTAAGFTVISTRDADLFDPLNNDQRAEIANRTHAVACIVIHASASGTGVHLYSSALMPPADVDADGGGASSAFVATPWDRAQTGFVRQSLQMTRDLGAALGTAHLPVVIGHEPVRPLDNLTCPAVALELAPLTASSVATPVTDPGYQQRVANTLSAALLAWRDHAVPLAPSAAAGVQTVNPTAKVLATKAAAKATAVADTAGLAAAKAHRSLGLPSGVHATASKNMPTSSFMSKAPLNRNTASAVKTYGTGRTGFVSAPSSTSFPAIPPTHATTGSLPSPNISAFSSGVLVERSC